MRRSTIIAANWKMHKTISESVAFIKDLTPYIQGSTCEILLAPPFTALSHSYEAARGTPIQIGGQNMHASPKGAFTGEVSASMLKDAGASFVILGHSERRTQFGETDDQIQKKIERAISEGIRPILCIGEGKKERERGHVIEVLQRQIDGCLGSLAPRQLSELIIAYEPVWAIGTGKAATSEIVQEAHKAIRSYLALKDPNWAESIPILYGGSVNPTNIAKLMEKPDIDGALIGGASLEIATFTPMVQR